MKTKTKTEELTLRYVDLDTVARWRSNPKRHDMGAIMQSIRDHGFKDPPKFEPKLNNGKGGLVEGNGRDEALLLLKKDNPENPPRGILREGEKWLVPILFGVDAESAALAEAYAIDHNNLTMQGGDFTALDIARMWEMNEYTDILSRLAAEDALPVSVDANSLELLTASFEGLGFDFGEQDGGEDGGEARRTKITLTLALEETHRLEEIVSAVRGFVEEKGFKVSVDA